jgi:hypothetical protein
MPKLAAAKVVAKVTDIFGRRLGEIEAVGASGQKPEMQIVISSFCGE